jgi:hypothetical protein
MGGYLYLYNCMSAFVFLDLRNGLTSNEEGGLTAISFGALHLIFIPSS